MIPHILSRHADAAGQRYKDLTDSWQVLFSKALTHPDFGAGGMSSVVIQEAYEIAQSYLDRETDMIASTLHEIAAEAQGLASRDFSTDDAELLAVEAQTHLGETQQYLRDEIVAQIHRDIANVRQSLQRVVLDVSMLARTQRVKGRAAVITWRLANDETLDFNFTDRRAHRTPSSRFIRNIWRQTLLSVHNETTLFTLTDHGQTVAGIYKELEGAIEQVAKLQLDGQGPGYGEIRATWFHPNSNAYLGAL